MKPGIPRQKILVVDDEPDVVDLLRVNLEGAGFEVLEAADGSTALRKAQDKLPNLIILDLMLPVRDGFEICKELRAHPDTRSIPVLMLTAKASEIDRVLGFEFGADDYVTKPFSPRELILRVKALLRRSEGPVEPAERIQIGILTIDVARHLVLVRNQPVELTAKEFRLLTLLAQRRGRVFSRDALLHQAWDYDASVDTRTVDTHIRRLREKLGAAAEYIDTVRGTGYRCIEF
ncbi:MAG: response regulator transcription factor [Verrucomicrobiota bacterium]|jgi:two-component system, OmpR family, phosphate regulon response regulator PhoB